MNEAKDYKDYLKTPTQNSTELALVKEVTKEHTEALEPTHLSKSNKKKMSKNKKRFYAFNVDLYAIIILHKIGIFSYINFISQSFEYAPSPIRRALLGNIDQMYISTFMFTYFSYFLVSYYLGHGKTMGSTCFELRAVSHEGSPKELSFMESFMRTLGYTVNYLCIFTPFLINLVRKDSKGIPDFFSQTEIMTEKEFLHYEHTLKAQKAEQEAIENQSVAQIIEFPAKKEVKTYENQPIDENSLQLDLFSA